MGLVTREELSELDRRIAASVARGEAAIARGEAATARFEVAMAKWAKQAEREDQLLAEIRAERLEERDERRAMIEGLMRMIDRLLPPQTAT